MECEKTDPPIKKMKFVNLSDKIDQYVEQLKLCKNLKPVLGDEICQPLPQIKITVGHIRNPKDISKAIQILNENIPLKEFCYLKRARGRDVLLCPSSHLSGLSSIQEYLETNVPILKDMFEYFKEVDVPSIAPKVKNQLTQSWSFNFHPNKHLESLVGEEFFTKDQMRFHIRIMHMVFEVIRWYEKDASIDVLNDINAAIVVDPTISTVVAISITDKDHPIKHAAMVAIDNVSKTQNGGAWGDDTSKSSNCTLSGIDKDLLIDLKREFRCITFGARIFKSKKDSEAKEDTSDSPYLCTGYQVYMLREPCVMCAMALVHARAKEIYFCFENKEHGGVKSKVKLQAIPALNHHFEVFTGFL